MMVECLSKRPMVFFSLSLMAGIITAYASGSILLVASTVLPPVAILSWAGEGQRSRWFLTAGFSLFFLLGAFEYLYFDGLNKARFAALDGERLTLRGYVDSQLEFKGMKVSFVLKVTEVSGFEDEKEASGEGIGKSVDSKRKKPGGKVLVSMLYTEDGSFPEYGRRINVTGRLTLPQGVRNPGGFDYGKYLAQKGISAMMFVNVDSLRMEQTWGGSAFISAGLAVRKRIVDVIQRSLPKQQAALLDGILIGYTGGMSEEVRDVFSDAGISHVTAVSGANVAFVALPFIVLFKRLKFRPNLSNLLVILILVFFVFITGFEPSVLRAVVMAVIILIGGILKREADIHTTIAFSAILLLIGNPYMLFSIGFQLSYAATLSLVLLYKNIRTWVTCRWIPGFAGDVLAATLAAQIGVLPITVFYFNKVSIVSILCNLLVVPLMEVITILGMAMALLGQIWIGFSQILGYLNCSLLSFVLLTSRVTAGLPFATAQMATPALWWVLLYYPTVWFFLWYKPRFKPVIRSWVYAAAGAVIIIPAVVVLLMPRGMEVIFLDVGEGDAAFIRTAAGKTILIDGGGSAKPASGKGVGESVVLPFLLDQGVLSLDLVVATHGHADHIQGLVPVLKNMKVSCLVIPRCAQEGFDQLLQAAGERGVPIERCEAGDRVILDRKTVFHVLSPSSSMEMEKLSLNNTSLVLQLVYEKVRILFVGDIEQEVEAYLLEKRVDLHSEVLKVGHHGSGTSTSEEFLGQIGPDAAIVSVGRNDFGHPSPTVLQRLEDSGVRVFLTQENGALVLATDGRTIRVQKTVVKQEGR